jgi:ParG
VGSRFDKILGQNSDKAESHQQGEGRTFYMKDEKYLKLKIAALQQGRTVTAIVNELVDEWLSSPQNQ